MKIKMITMASGPTCSLKAGGVYEVGVAPGLTPEFAKALLDGRYAKPHVEEAVQPEEGETAVEEAPRGAKSTAAKPKAEKKTEEKTTKKKTKKKASKS